MAYSASSSLYLNPNIEYLFDKTIFEYDIQNAGLSIIKEYKLLSDDKINELSTMNKMRSHIAIGMIQRENKEFSQTLLTKFADVRQRFISANILDDNDIISVKKDAFFITKNCTNTTFGNVKFVNKNKYSSYIRFVDNNNIECYYSSNGIDIKGMSTISENKHRLYTIDLLMRYFDLMESRNETIKRMMMDFISRYKNQKLDGGYYLEFNNKSHDINPLYNYIKLIIPLIQIINGELI